MNRSRLLLPFLLLATWCSTGNQWFEPIAPELRVQEAPGQMKPWKHQQRVPFNVIVVVLNHSSESIELERLAVHASPSSLSAMKLDPVNRQLNVVIPSEQMRTIDLWLSTWVELPNLDGGTQTTLRVTAYFESDLGRFRRVYNLPILDPGTRDPPTPR